MGSTQANNTLGSSSRDYGKPPSLVSTISSTRHRLNSGSHRETALAWKILEEQNKEHTFLQLWN